VGTALSQCLSGSAQRQMLPSSAINTDVQWENRLEDQKLDWGKAHSALKGLFKGYLFSVL